MDLKREMNNYYHGSDRGHHHQHNHHHTWYWGIVVTGTTSLGTVLYLYYKNKQLKQELLHLRQKMILPLPPEEEEIATRKENTNQSTKQQQQKKKKKKEKEEKEMLFQYFTMREIGIIRSPYPHRAGTPRQGLLAKHSRSHLELHSHVVPKECLDGLEEYSHVWIFFQFHLNPIGKQGAMAPTTSTTNKNKKKKKDSNSNNSNNNVWFTSTKVKPPRANGKKVGVLATRSPHRPNNIGLSLAKLESITTEYYHDYETDDDNDNDSNHHPIQSKSNKKKKKTRGRPKKRIIVKLLGLDLVDGTPIYDIKPYLPWDQVTQSTTTSHKLLSRTIPTTINNNDYDPLVHTNDMKTITNDDGDDDDVLRVPSWVSEDDELSSVTWTQESYNFVLTSRNNGDLSPLYPPPIHKNKKGRQQSNKNLPNDEVHKAIAEIIAQDPRAQKEGRGKIMTNDDKYYDITFCTLRISFKITQQQPQQQQENPPLPNNNNNNNNLSNQQQHHSNNNNIPNDMRKNKNVAQIIKVVQDPGDPDAQPGSYQHSLAMRRFVEQEQLQLSNKTIRWKHPIREGCTEGLYELLHGGTCEPSQSL